MTKSRAQDKKILRERTSNSRSFGAAVETSGPYIRNYIGNDMKYWTFCFFDIIIRIER